jgi:hypothetical protein
MVPVETDPKPVPRRRFEVDSCLIAVDDEGRMLTIVPFPLKRVEGCRTGIRYLVANLFQGEGVHFR